KYELDAIGRRLDRGHACIEANLDALCLNGRSQSIHEGLKTALIGAEADAACLNARPHPRHIDFIESVAKFADEQRTPERFVNLPAHPALHPFFRRRAF